MSGTVRLTFPASAVHVRTARLVAVTVARRSGWDEETVESVRQGVGEACALALRTSADGGPLVLTLDVETELDVQHLLARVGPLGPHALTEAGSLERDVLSGLTDEVDLEGRAGAHLLRLRWSGPAR